MQNTFTNIEILSVHFDVPQHYLSAKTFVDITICTESLINNLNKEFFAGQVEYQIVVFPPEEGSFLKKIGIGIVAVGTSAFAFISSDPGSAFIEGLTKHPTTYWFNEAGKKMRDAYITPPDLDKSNKVAGLIIAQATKGFLEEKPEALVKMGFVKSKFRAMYEAKNSFYSACHNDRNVAGVGFEEVENYPTKRPDFPFQIVELPIIREEKLQEMPNWKVEITFITVTSPNWERSDTNKRHWKAKGYDNEDILFTIEDDGFWKLVETRELKPEIYDSLKVQLAYEEEGRRKKSIIILRVLEYNGKFLSKALTKHELEARLYVYSEPEKIQLGLFEQQDLN
jgi:hypothetical protein